MTINTFWQGGNQNSPSSSMWKVPNAESRGIRYIQGRPYMSGKPNADPDAAALRRHSLSPSPSVVMPPISPEFGQRRGSLLSRYGVLGNSTRPNTVPDPFNLETSKRSRRPLSRLSQYPPGKEPGVSIQERIRARELMSSPPPKPVNWMIGSAQVIVKDVQKPSQAPKESEFVRLARARSRGSLFERSFGGSKPLGI
ncbi:hypothetical protein GUITHDRAFT_112965 [Guillardia theta CCMP2712]|uniref:Uncharacterized protein n=1 Tax=Guillardia theta (strain CCMP2712) TaxID=905079 RepID=L1IYQ7_GUITC|nr:hypothetical protein GUITHDRAFT_112965 [Guillardia theta CCMP2712]EKX40960.1 hypothetical protein GUITHDRAFT_112965 [Guillardia theta CCMP2712]|eukprot:XP_005827940.1 hypothetical protein GUITHDRAFT_112965 [Guillardia theta CCMP2712]